MEKIKALLKQRKPSHERNYKKTSTANIRLLYVSPSVNSDGYHRMILPYLELQKHEGFETRMTSIRKWDFRTTFTLGEDAISEADIRWASHILFPMLLSDHTYLFQAIRVLNPKVRLVMDVTRRILQLPNTHPDYFLYSKAQQIHFGNNLVHMDLITTATLKLAEYYHSWMVPNGVAKNKTRVAWLPTLISPIGFEGLDKNIKRDDTIRIGLINTFRTATDFDHLLPTLKTIQKKYPENVQFIVMGWNGKHPNGAKPLEGLKVNFYKSVSFLAYYETLQKLGLDIWLLPTRNGFNTIFTDTIKFLEASALGIPVIADFSMYEECIEDGYNGLLANNKEDWESNLVDLIENPDYRKKLGITAKQWVWEQQGFTHQNLYYFRNVYQGFSWASNPIHLKLQD